MAGLNKVMIIGNLGRDPEIRYSQDGAAVVNFPIATSEQWTDKNTGDKQEKTEWHRIVVFRKLAEVCERYLSKGRQVYVEGKLRTSSYEKDGQTHYSTDIVASTVQFLGTRQDNQDGGSYQGSGGGGYQQQSNSGNNDQYQNQTSPGAGRQQPVPDDDIPF